MSMDPEDMDECYRCGAVVFRRAQHREWHEKLEGPEPKEKPPGSGYVHFA